MTTIQINGENKQVEQGCTVETLLATLGLSDKRLAVEINRQIVPRSSYPSQILNDSDVIEIVHAIGGG